MATAATTHEALDDFARFTAAWCQKLEGVCRKKYDPELWVTVLNDWINMQTRFLSLLNQALDEGALSGAEADFKAHDTLRRCSEHLSFWMGPLITGCQTLQPPLQVLSDFTKVVAETYNLKTKGSIPKLPRTDKPKKRKRSRRASKTT